MSLIYRIASIARAKVDEVMDAHLEQLSMIICVFIFAWIYGWIEATAIAPFWTLYEGKYGHLPWWVRLVWWNQFSYYQLVFAIMTLAVTFSFGLIKIHRMFKQKRRYLVFTALGNFVLSMLALDVSYFVYHEFEKPQPGAWTTWPFGGLWIGKIYVPWWWFIAIFWCGFTFFLAYRSALYNFLLEREVEQKLVAQAAPTELAPEPTPQEPAPPAPREDFGDYTPIEKPEPELTPTPEEEIRRRLLVKKELEKKDA